MRCVIACLASVSLYAQDIGPAAFEVPDPGALVRTVSALAGDASAAQLCRARGLDLLSLTWEDAGRAKNSCWGPNISDLTIQVLGDRGVNDSQACMPVIRRPNFSDVSCDVPIGHLKLLVGNEHGGALHAVDLGDYLQHFADFQHAPTGAISGCLLDPRDREVLVSAQACVLPVAAGAAVGFAPVLFNYQAQAGDPAVLVIMATPEGTSAQVMSANAAASAGVYHGHRLFFNRDGQRAALRAQRFSDVQGQAQSEPNAAPMATSAQADGLSMVLIIQVPLVQHASPVRELDDCAAAPAAACAGKVQEENAACATETAVVSSGAVEGPWLGLDQCTITRDTRFPIRATVQFYQATSRPDLTYGDVQRLGAAIDHIYLDADAVGSLVVAGATGRTTEPDLAPAWPQPWWAGPCQAYAASSGEPWQVALARIRLRLGADWQPADARELSNALALARP